jgi:hypothetical protein
VSSGAGGIGAGMGTVSHRARQLQSGDCGSTRSCSRALDALCGLWGTGDIPDRQVAFVYRDHERMFFVLIDDDHRRTHTAILL